MIATTRVLIIFVHEYGVMQKSLGHWIEGGQKGWLAWGIFIFKKI